MKKGTGFAEFIFAFFFGGTTKDPFGGLGPRKGLLKKSISRRVFSFSTATIGV